MVDLTPLGFYCNGVLNTRDLDSALHPAQGNGTLWGEEGISERLVGISLCCFSPGKA